MSEAAENKKCAVEWKSPFFDQWKSKMSDLRIVTLQFDVPNKFGMFGAPLPFAVTREGAFHPVDIFSKLQ